MAQVFQALLLVHIVVGFFGLVAFWFPVLSGKGGRFHMRTGRAFLYAGYVVGGTAVVLAILTAATPFTVHPDERPALAETTPEVLADMRSFAVFLAYLGVITVATVHHGVRAMQTRRRPAAIRTPLHTVLNATAVVSSLVVGVTGVVTAAPPLLALTPLGVLVGGSALRYARRDPASPMAYWYEHMGAMIGGGIAFHTAFAVFGIRRFVAYDTDGLAGIAPWILPGVVGTIASLLWQRRYRQRFGERKDQMPLPVPPVAG